MKELFGVNTIEELKKLFDAMKPFIENRQERYRYITAFEYADLITDYVKVNEIGMLN